MSEMTQQLPDLSTDRGFPGLPCPRCGDVDMVSIDLEVLTGLNACHCSSCDADFSLADVINLFDAWLPVLQWIAQAPRR